MTEAKNKLIKLLVQVENGERIIIQRHGMPIAEIQQPQPHHKPRFATLKGRVKISDPNWATAQSEDEWLAGR